MSWRMVHTPRIPPTCCDTLVSHRLVVAGKLLNRLGAPYRTTPVWPQISVAPLLTLGSTDKALDGERC